MIKNKQKKSLSFEESDGTESETYESEKPNTKLAPHTEYLILKKEQNFLNNKIQLEQLQKLTNNNITNLKKLHG